MSIFKSYTPEQIENHLSNYLINSWSYSKVSQFARNEKAFEMIYLYGFRAKSSASTIAGNAYHEALKNFFRSEFKLTLPELEKIAYDYIEEQPANNWKLQKTTPTVAECINVTTKTVTALLSNFFKEVEIYTDSISKILDVEVYITDFLTINGVDIPIPANMMIDLVIETKDGKTVIIDHKSKKTFSSEEELSLSIGKQAMTYVKGYEAKNGIVIDEVWFYENKYSKNKSGEPQINVFKVILDENTRKIYEVLLYEPLKRMIDAISDPDHTYIINDNDNFIDRAELYDFWAKTLLSDVYEFDIPDGQRELIEKRMRKIKDSSMKSINPKIIKEFKQNASKFIQYDLSTTDMTQQQKIEHILRTFSISTQVAHTFNGFSSNSYLLEVSAGTKIASILTHKLDIANALNVSNVRISKNLKVYEGKSFLEIETAKKRDRDLIWDSSEIVGNKIPIGKDNLNKTVFWDIDNHSTPHILICGATGSGKSASLISTISYAQIMKSVKEIVIMDPKYEFLNFASSPKTQIFNDILDIEEKMKDLVDEMQELVRSGKTTKKLIVIDEFADALAASRKGKELDLYEDVTVGYYRQSATDVLMGIPAQPKIQRQKIGELKSLEENLRILLQKGRSVGFRIISATQRASTKIITGDAKVNYPVQICFRVPKEIDSRVVIDEPGAETLAGMGDGLIKSPEFHDLIRFQAFYKP